MRLSACLLLAATAFAGLAPTAQAEKIDFEYQVWAFDPPTWVVSVLVRGMWVVDSYHDSLSQAKAREDKLELNGDSARVNRFYPSRQWIAENSYFVEAFDTLDEAEDYADILESKTGLFTYIETVEVYPGGP